MESKLILLLVVLWCTVGRSYAVARQSPPLIEKQPPTDLLLFQVAQRIDEADKPIIIECEASGSPEPQYKWTKDGQEFNWTEHGDRIIQQAGRGSLEIKVPRAEDVGQYQCFASNAFGVATSNSVFLRKAELNSFSDDTHVEAIVAEEGKPFNLTCKSPEGWPPPRMDWMLHSKQGDLKSINSSRLTVDPHGTLWFSNVTQSDKSTDRTYYACSAYSPFRHEYKLGSLVYLNVLPGSSPSIQNRVRPAFQYVSSETTMGTRGDKLDLWCIVSGTPVPEISWTKNGRSLPSEGFEYENYNKTLRILKVDEDSRGNYECRASNGVGSPISHSIELKVDAAPYFTHEPELINAADDETVEFVCEARGVPDPVIKWIHNGKPLEEASPNSRRTLLSSNKIEIKNIVKTDTGNYGCNATNSLGYVYKDVYVNVLTIPASIIENPRDLVTIAGQTAVFICRVFGAPKPLVQWTRNEEVLTGSKYKVLSNGDLEIKSVSFADMGDYTCVASNKFGNDSKPGSLVVKEPTVIREPPEDYQVAAGNPVTFHCKAFGDQTLNLKIDWLHNGGLINFASEPRYSKLEDNSLSISEPAVSDSGKYTCLARTEFDNATAEAKLVVQDVPNRPEIVSIDCQITEATLKWKSMGDNRAPILDYTIEFNTSFTPNKWEIKTGQNPPDAFTYTASLSPWTNYTFRVLARNIIGLSPPSIHSEACTTPPDVPFENPEAVKAAKASPNTLRITWDPMPEIDHNAPKFYYQVQYKLDDDSSEWTTQNITDWKTNELVVHNQPIYKPYLIKIRAVNEEGQTKSEPVVVKGFSGQDIPSEAPGNLTLWETIDSRSARLSWSAVNASSLNGKFEGYKVETWKEGDEEGVYTTIKTQNSVTEAVIEKLTPNTRNFVRVYAYNTDHQGPYSRVVQIITGEGTPGAVRSFQIKPLGTSSLYLIWEKPEEPNGKLIGYRINYVPVPESGRQARQAESDMRQRVPLMDPEVTRAKLSGLEPNTLYKVSLAAVTSVGPGVDFVAQQRTFGEDMGALYSVSKPKFVWKNVEITNGLAAILVTWMPTFENDQRPGSHFYVQYKEHGSEEWITRPEVQHEDYEIVRDLEPDRTYNFRVVSVDGKKSTPSDSQEIFPGGPTILATRASVQEGWFIALIVSLAFILLVIILFCIVKRNRGGKYAVYEREMAYRGRLDRDDGNSFPEYARPGGPAGRPISPASEPMNPNNLESDTDSIAEYGDEEATFTEDGSFIGEYGDKNEPKPDPPSTLATFV